VVAENIATVAVIATAGNGSGAGRQRPVPFSPMGEHGDAEAQTDAALLVAYANGDGAAAGQLTERLLPRVLGQAYRMLRDRAEAEDVAQEAMIRLWKIAPDWQQDKAKISTWMYRVVANLCTDKLRGRKRHTPLDLAPDPEDPGVSAPERLEQNERAEALSRALAELPERQSQAVALRHLEGCSNPEIAEIMDISVEAVESFFAAAKDSELAPSTDLMARVLADAEALQPVVAAVSAPKQNAWAGFMDMIGGWPALSGVAAAGVAGIWLGVAPPTSLEQLTSDMLGTSTSVSLLSDIGGLVGETIDG